MSLFFPSTTTTIHANQNNNIPTTLYSPSSSPLHNLLLHLHMEERAPPLPPLPQQRSPEKDKASATAGDSDVDDHPHTHHQRRETIIIQAPKDQIFRVPPPENARILEEYRNRQKKKKGVPCLEYLWWVLGIAFGIVLISLASWVTFYLIVRPKPPEFTVAGFTVNTSKKLPPEYAITLKVGNPSRKLDYVYKGEGTAVLYEGGKHIATGVLPKFNAGHGNGTTFKQILQGSKSPLPKDVEKSLQGSKDTVNLSLSIEFPLSSSLGFLEWSENIVVDCKIRANALGKEGNVVSQTCNTKSS